MIHIPIMHIRNGKNYKEYDNLRSEIIDYGFPSYYENSETYDSLGLNGEDVWFYQNWNFADPEKFNIESMEKILELRPEKKDRWRVF